MGDWKRLTTRKRCFACGSPMHSDSMVITDGQNDYCGDGCYSIRIDLEKIHTRQASWSKLRKKKRRNGAPRPSAIHETPLPLFARRNAH